MKKLLMLFFVLALVCLGAFRGYRFLMGEPSVTVLEVRSSPDEQWEASLVRTSSGGATVGFSYQVNVVLRGGSAEGTEEWVWRSYKVAPVSVDWLSGTRLLVTVQSSGQPYFDTIETRKIHGIKTGTRVVPDGRPR